MKQRLTLLIFVIAGLVSYAETSTGHPRLSQQLREMVVENPDSVLTILDSAEAVNTDGLPPFRIALLRGLAYNEKRMFSLVERYAMEALNSDSIDSYPNEKLNALTLLSCAQGFYGNYQGCIETAINAINLARQQGNKPGELNILTTMAKTSFDMGHRKQGYEYLGQILAFEKDATTARELANISAAYGVKIIELYAEDKYDEALQEGYKRLALIDRIDQIGGAPDGFTDQQRAYAYARIASCAQKAGKIREARDAYDKFLSTTYGESVIGRSYITDYLMEAGQWRTVLDFTRPLFPLFTQSDTINDDFRSLLVSNAKAEYGLGNYKEGYSLIERAAAIQDSLYLREKNSKAQELATVFSLNEKELELQKSRAESQRKHTMMIAAIGIGVLILVILLLLLLQYRRTVRRNRIAAQQIDELQTQREKLLAAKKEIRTDIPSGENEFQKIEQKIREDRIFTNPDLNRDSLAEACGVSRGKIMQLIQENTGLTPNDYINKLRVEYSILLIKQHPEWTIDAIAEGAGYIRRATYYSHFNKLYGMTPAQYRKNSTHQSPLT